MSDPASPAEGPAAKAAPALGESMEDAQRALAVAEARIAALKKDRHYIERELATWEKIAKHSHALVRHYEERSDQLALHLGGEPRGRGRPPEPSAPRIATFVAPIADRLITERGGPVTIREIYEALPSEIRAELDSASTVYSTPYRLRRFFRRDKRYIVDKELIGLAAGASDPVPSGVVVRKVVREDGSTAAFELLGPDETAYAKPKDVRDLLRRGGRVGIRCADGNEAQLALSGAVFTSYSDGVETDDFKNLSEVPLDEVRELMPFDDE
jgi:hypothetical protein